MNFSCKAQWVGIGQFVRCLEHEPQECDYVAFIGNASFCQSPLRHYLFTKSYEMSSKNVGAKVLYLSNKPIYEGKPEYNSPELKDKNVMIEN